MILRRLGRALIIALVTSLVAESIDYATNVEITQGLDRLFQLRGPRLPPSEVVVVAMDESSETALQVGRDLTSWRKFHAQLVSELQSKGAALVIFDLQFIASQPDYDPAFADAIKKAGNVLITQCYQKQGKNAWEFSGRDECADINQNPIAEKPNAQQTELSRNNLPTPILAAAALDHAPFYVPNDAEDSIIRETWTFSRASLTLPPLAWIYYLDRTGALKNRVSPSQPFSEWSQIQRQQCHANKANAFGLSNNPPPFDRFLYQVICGSDSRVIDYYGPPNTLRYESYSDVYAGKVADLQGKVVFVGKANRQYLAGKTDFFYTPFTNTETGKMPGVEIMATLFANLLENRVIAMPLPPALALPLFGLGLGLCLTCTNGRSGLILSLLVTVGYVVMAVWLFNSSAIWLPIACPVLIQLPLAGLLASRWQRMDAETRERHLALAFAQRVPEWQELLKATIGNVHYDHAFDKEVKKLSASRDVFGLCLSTDIKDYTVIARRHSAHQLMELLQHYYQLLASPVRSGKGIIANVIGDSMMALWIDAPAEQLRNAACIAALEIQLAVARFNASSTIEPLYTRIGIHEGDMTLGKLVLDNPGNLNPIGDAANTASRIEGVNKYLGTQILASAVIAPSLAGIVYRPVGKFYLVGRDEAIELVEVMALSTDNNPARAVFLQEFAAGLNAFQQGTWPKAEDTFRNILNYYSHDGPSQFYLGLAIQYQTTPPTGWDGIVRFESK